MTAAQYIAEHWTGFIFGAIFIFTLYKLFRYRGLFDKATNVVGDELDEHEKYIS